MRHLFPHKRQGRSAEAPCVVVNSNTRQRLYDIVVAFARQDVDEFAYILESLDGLVPFYIDEPGKFMLTNDGMRTISNHD